MAGGNRCLYLKLLSPGSTNGVPESTPGQEVQAAGLRGGSLAGKLGREETVLPPVLRGAAVCRPLRGLPGREGPEHPGGAAGCHAGLRCERLGQAPREQGFLPLLTKTAIWLTPRTRCPAKLKFGREFGVP